MAKWNGRWNTDRPGRWDMDRPNRWQLDDPGRWQLNDEGQPNPEYDDTPGWQKFANRTEGWEKWGALTPEETAGIAAGGRGMQEGAAPADTPMVQGSMNYSVVEPGSTPPPAPASAPSTGGGAPGGQPGGAGFQLTGNEIMPMSGRPVMGMGQGPVGFGMQDEEEALLRLGKLFTGRGLGMGGYRG